MNENNSSNKLAYVRVITMAFGAFIFNTTEFIPVALLSDIAHSFDMDVSKTGFMMTIYAWVVFLMSLPCILLTAKLERRGLLLKLFILFISCHILSVIAWDYWVLVLSRAGIALTHATFWAMTPALILRIAPKNKQTQALGLLAMGSALAMVLGLPLGRLIGQWFDWRTTFAIIAIFAFVLMLILIKVLPQLPSKNTGSLASVPMLLKRPILVGLYAFTLIAITAHFTAYSYVEPFMMKISQFSSELATVILLIFGVSGIVASILFSRFHRLSPNVFLAITSIFLIGSLICLLPLSEQFWAMFLLVFIWGIGISGISLSLQMRVLQQASDATDVATAMYSGIYNLGIGGGALIGSLVMQYLGLGNIGFVGAVLMFIAINLFIVIQKKHGQTQS